MYRPGDSEDLCWFCLVLSGSAAAFDNEEGEMGPNAGQLRGRRASNVQGHRIQMSHQKTQPGRVLKYTSMACLLDLRRAREGLDLG